MAKNFGEIESIVRQYVADVKRTMPIDKVFLYGPYTKCTATEQLDVNICFFLDLFEDNQSTKIAIDLWGLARKYNQHVYFYPLVLYTSDIECDNPFIREILRTGREIA